jgi:hypothetical protein
MVGVVDRKEAAMGDAAAMTWFLATVICFSILMVGGMFIASHTYVKHVHDPYPGDGRDRMGHS